MFRYSRYMRQGGIVPPGGHGGGTGGFPPGVFPGPAGSFIQGVPGSGRTYGGGAMDPEAMQAAMKAAMAQVEKMTGGKPMPSGGPGGPEMKMKMMAFGTGVNEKGKRVARAASAEMDPTTGKRLNTEFHEKQLDPDDPQLAKGTDYDADAIEIDIDAEPTKEVERDATAPSESSLGEVEIIEEVEVIPVDNK